jgi:hypothetical protein
MINDSKELCIANPVVCTGIQDHASTVCSWQAYPLIQGLSFLEVFGNWMHPARKGPSRLQVIHVYLKRVKHGKLSLTAVEILHSSVILCNLCNTQSFVTTGAKSDAVNWF